MISNMKKSEPQLTRFALSNDVIAFSTTRHGGASKGNYAAFNINPYCGDDPLAIEQNRLALADCLNIDPNHIIFPHQTHNVNTRVIDEDFFALNADDRARFLDGIDALVTRIPNICIGVSTADCIPLLIYDPILHVVAAIHAGWRGTAKRIVQHAIETMHSAFGCDPKTLKAVICPGISLKNFEVGDEVYDAFAAENFDMTRIAHRFTKWHIDLPTCNLLQLLDAGLQQQNILLSGICTYDANADYFSARRQGIASGRIFNGIMMPTKH